MLSRYNVLVEEMLETTTRVRLTTATNGSVVDTDTTGAVTFPVALNAMALEVAVLGTTGA